MTARSMPPLDADGYLRWLWQTCGSKSRRPMTAREWWLAFDRPNDISPAESRKQLTRNAAYMRKRMRLRRMADRNGSVLP